MKSKLIRFVEKKEYLIDDIKNGFVLKSHNISFRPSVYEILPSLIDFWTDKGISSEIINPILENYRALDEPSFWKWYCEKLQQDNIYNFNISNIMNQINSAKIKMKCFTELRDNQKLHNNHSYWFGDYGICLTQDWILKNKGDRVIYVDNDSEVTNRIGRLMCMLSSVFSGKSVIKAIFDILSFTEISENSHEYEWRIVGNHHYAGKSYGTFPDKIIFSNDDIVSIFVKDESEVDEIVAILKEKMNREKSQHIPQVNLTKDIFLTDSEMQEIQEIHNRRKTVFFSI